MLRINVLGGLYVSDDGRAVSGAAAQPRRLALVALLAVAGERGVTRDALLAYLWPDADEERGRRALAQALYALRRDLGSDEAFIGVKDLRLNPDVVHCDLWEFHDAAATGDLERAADLYKGRFLEGFHLPGADSFEKWVEDSRVGLNHELVDLLHSLATRSSERGEHRAATGWLRKLAAQDPLNARIACQLMESLAAQGDVAGALQHSRVYESLIRQELDLPPDREVLVLAARLRGSAGEAAAPASVSIASQESPPLPPSSPTETAVGEISDVDLPVGQQSGHTSGWATLTVPRDAITSTPVPRSDNRRWWPWAAAAVVIVGITTAILTLARRPAAAAAPSERVVAVGRIAHYGRSGPGSMGQPLADMLATNLARAAGVRMISSARMYELLGELGTASDTTTGLIVAAARRAGATELVDGALYEVTAGYLRLDLRRVDLATGGVLHAYTIQGPDLFALADSGTGRLVDDIGGQAPVGSVADVSTRSVDAYRAYEAGLRSYYGGDVAGAEKLFAQALAKDSTFAMAQFYYSLATSSGSRAEGAIRLKRAVDLADRAGDRERLLIRATWAFSNSSPSVRAYAETLTVRYPTEVEGYIMAGQGAINAADFHAARGPFLEAIARDSLGFKGQKVRCLGCEAASALIGSLIQEDSLSAALAIAQRWVRLQPAVATPRRYMALVLSQMGMADSARKSLRGADSLLPDIKETVRFLIPMQMWNNQFDSAGELSRSVIQTGESQERTEGYWNLALAYRHLGRMTEALDLARNYRTGKAEATPRGSAPLSAYLQGQVLFELGRFKEAAALFDSISRTSVPFEDSSLIARNRVWSYTHLATALAGGGDTLRLAALADTMQRLGQVSGLERDRRLHHYVRGLLFQARGMDDRAVAEFRTAITSRNSGYTRINYQMAGSLMRLKRPAEAIPLLQVIIRSAFEGAALYLTHTDAHERLAQAWEATGQRDSAAAHYRLVARLWENADPGFTPRRLDAAGRALQLLEKR